MRYWYDLEFIEDGRTIDVISIGMVAEDGREYYAQNWECKFRRASPWVRENVFPHLRYFDMKRLRPLNGPHDAPAARSVWRGHRTIAEDLMKFCAPQLNEDAELWGYYAAYDHVALCQFFGTMMDLPKGFPMWTHDIMQLRALRGYPPLPQLGDPSLPDQNTSEHNALTDARWNKQVWWALQEQVPGTPKPIQW